MSVIKFDFDDHSEYVEHYGVMGMKWGKWNSETARKYSGGSGRARKAVKKEVNSFRARRAVKAKRSKMIRNRSTLSDKELNKISNRLKSEQNLRKLGQSEVHPGRSATAKTLSKIGGAALTGALSGAVAYATITALNSAGTSGAISAGLATSMVSGVTKAVMK